MDTYDYVVVGGGSAGCTVTNRLIKAGKSVLMIEAGPTDDNPFVRMPGGFIKLFGSERTWIYLAEPQSHANGRVIAVPQGRTLGGGSSVNAMIYVRGQSQDYDGWRDAGNPGWGWDDVLPVFKRLEANQRITGPTHGNSGPLPVQDLRYRHPLTMAAVRAAQEAGYPYNDDFNGPKQDGVGFYQTTMKNAVRASAAAVFLRPIEGHPNLKVLTDTYVGRVLTENGAAVGVAFADKAGNAGEARVREEVILTAGALATPKVLQLSGVGPAAHLAQLGIPVVRDMPGVGENYQDHIDVPLYCRVRDPISLIGQDKGLNAVRHYLQYRLFKTGLLTSNVVDSGAFIDTAGEGRPDIQFHFIPQLLGDPPRDPPAGHGVSVLPAILAPKSRGTVRLRSTNPQDPILFDPRYLSAPEDVAAFIRGIKVARKIIQQPALKALGGEEISPLGEPLMKTDADMEKHTRAYAKTIFHPVGTCRMGSDDKAVVDQTLKVRGVPRLRICDASIMPVIPRGNTNAPTIMIADRCADFILGGK